MSAANTKTVVAVRNTMTERPNDLDKTFARFRLGSTKKPIAIGNRKCYITRNSGDCTSTLNGRTR